MTEPDPVSNEYIAALFGRWLHSPLPRCALAVSGGSDSMALMVLFADWLKQLGDNPARHAVLTVDHGLRPQSATEAKAVAAQAAALGFRHATLRWDGGKPQTGIQAAARTARYGLMRTSMRQEGLAVLLTGHTRDDQAETLLMRLARGSGLDGLAGMAPRLSFRDLGMGEPAAADSEPEIVRPLLDVPRARLRAVLQARGIPWIDDPSNQALHFERPRLRAARGELDALGLTDQALALSATRLHRARRAIDAAVNQFCSGPEGVVSVHASGYITIDRQRLCSTEEEIALRVLGRAIAATGGSGELVPLGKLEAIVTTMRSSDRADAKWTLARALVTARGDEVTLEREVGREALPVVSLSPGTKACWDGRFRVSLAAAQRPVEIRALGESAARELREHAVKVPLRVASLSPAIWHKSRLIAAPALGIWLKPSLRDLLEVHFLGADLILGCNAAVQENSDVMQQLIFWP